MSEAPPVESPRNTSITQGIGFDARPPAKRSVLKKMVDYGACLARMLEVTKLCCLARLNPAVVYCTNMRASMVCLWIVHNHIGYILLRIKWALIGVHC